MSLRVVEPHLLPRPAIRSDVNCNRPILAAWVLERQFTRYPLVRRSVVEIAKQHYTMINMMLAFHRPRVDWQPLIGEDNVLLPGVKAVPPVLQRIHPNRLNLSLKGFLRSYAPNPIPILTMFLPELQVARPRAVPPILLELSTVAKGVQPGKIVGFKHAASCPGFGRRSAAVVWWDACRDKEGFHVRDRSIPPSTIVTIIVMKGIARATMIFGLLVIMGNPRDRVTFLIAPNSCSS